MSCTTSKYYSVEYREKAGWDRGFVSSGVFLHLFGEDSRSYWVDQTPQGHGGLLTAGDEYVDAANKTYVAVNAIDSGSRTAQVTLGSRKIEAGLENLGPSGADFNDPVSLVADLKVSGSGAAVPEQPVLMSIGTENCVGTTDSNGHASCSLTIEQHPGAYTLSASFAGDTPMPRRRRALLHDRKRGEPGRLQRGADERLPRRIHSVGDPVRPRRRRTDRRQDDQLHPRRRRHLQRDHRRLSATHPARSPPPRFPGFNKIEASFGPDVDYLSSNDTQPFEITKEETTTTYTGPT